MITFSLTATGPNRSALEKYDQRGVVSVSQIAYGKLAALSQKTGVGVNRIIENLIVSALERLEAE
jgi:hypothetical protein